MSNPTPEALRRLLTELANTAEHASLTRSLAGGEKAAARAFNGALATLTAQGLVPDGMFQSLSLEDADYGTLGVQARLLLAMLPETEMQAGKPKDRDRDGGLGALVALAPFLNSQDLSEMIAERLDESREVPDGVLTALAPFLDSHHLGNLVRRRARPGAPPAPPTPPMPPTPPDPPVAKPTVAKIPDLRPAPVSEAPVTLESLAAELRRPDLSIEERQRIAMQLADLSYEQSIKALD